MKTFCLISTGVFIVLVVGGCAASGPLSAGVRAESQSADAVQIRAVRLRTTGQGLQVYGTVRRATGYSSSSQRHLDVVVRGPDNAVLQHAAVSFSPNPIRRGRNSPASSTYALTLPTVPPAGSVIRVTVHPISFGDCQFAAGTRQGS
jgi:hypothetical protein